MEWIDVLAWPENTPHDNHGRPGWAIGWKIVRPKKSHCLEPHMIIVAGVIPTELTELSSISVSSLQSEFDDLSTRIRRAQDGVCFCCTCRPNGDDCAGCTRRTCFQELVVLAMVKEQKPERRIVSTKKDETSSKLSVPLIYLSNKADDGRSSSRPLLSEAIDLQWRQLLLYDDGTSMAKNSHDFGCVVPFKHNMTLSQFSREMLARLSHAKAVANYILFFETSCQRESSNEHSSNESMNSSAVQPVKSLPSDAAVPIGIDPVSKDKKEKKEGLGSFLHTLWTFVRSHSLFVHHVRSTASSPLWSMFQLLRADNASLTDAAWCPCCSTHVPVLAESNVERAANLMAKCDQLVVAAVDSILGILVGCKLLAATAAWSEHAAVALGQIQRNSNRHLLQAVDWLEMFPIGFKLNVRLTNTLGSTIRLVFGGQQWLFERFLYAAEDEKRVNLQLLLRLRFIVVGVALVFGASGVTALLCDIVRLSTLHVSCLGFSFRQVFRTELFLLKAFWRLFRGKKRNILRQRTDTMEYDSTQLLLGTILFTTALFMLTTLLVYHAFFAALNMAIVVVTTAFVSIYLALRRFPWGKIWLQKKQPHLFVERVYLEDLPIDEDGDKEYQSSDHCVVSALRAKATAWPRLVSDSLLIYANPLGSWFYACFTQIIIGVDAACTMADGSYLPA
jgi:hypothetical protein